MGEYNQTSFSGGMNLIVDDTRIGTNEYREAFNVRNRFDVLDSVADAKELFAPAGNKQGIYTFGDFILLFIAGNAYYQHRLLTGWQRIHSFSMDAKVPRYFLESIPVSTTLNARIATTTNSNDIVNLKQNSFVSAGTPSGVVVQDGINQPRFIFIDSNGFVQCRVTQKFSEWNYDPTGVNDRREYVPIGTQMTFYDGVLIVLAPDGVTLLRSCSGRPLDFVINVDLNGNKGGDAYTSAYSVGVGPITCMRVTSGDGIFISAAQRFCFMVSFNRTPNALKIWGEYTFIRQYLFDAGCVNERSFINVLGDTAFIDPEGLRSYNAIVQQQNEGRNSIFSKKISPLFKGILQDDNVCAAVFDNFALFCVNTIYGRKVIVYDTLNESFVSMDDQSDGKGFKQLAQINTQVIELYGITLDDKVMKLYSAPTFASSIVRLGSNCSQNPKAELQPTDLRVVLSKFTEDSVVTADCFVNNRHSGTTIQKKVIFKENLNPWVGVLFSDVDTQVNNIVFNFNSSNQGWKCFFLLGWTGGGSITNIQVTTKDVTSYQSALTQAATA